MNAGALDGVAVMGSGPLRNAQIRLERISDAGAVFHRVLETETDAEGRFWIEMGAVPGPFLLTARGGTSRELWSDVDVVFDEDDVVLVAVVLRDHPGPVQTVVMSPLTTVGEVLGRNRFQAGLEASYWSAVEIVYEHLSRHVEADIVQHAPLWRADASGPTAPTAGVRHALALLGLSGLAHHAAAASGVSAHAWNTRFMQEALVEDASDAGMVLDGVGPRGPIELARCTPACVLGADALRSNLARAVAIDVLPSEAALVGVELRDILLVLDRMSENRDSILFGDATPAPLDREAPRIAALPSPVYDEENDRIAFAASGEPVHLHAGWAVVDLSRAFRGQCPLVRKHASTLREPEDNPLRWRFAVKDDIAGVAAESIQYRVGIRDAETVWLTSWERPALTSLRGDGGVEAEVVVLSGEVPDLTRRGGVYEIELRASDVRGNMSEPLRGCWEHEPLAPPLRVRYLGASEAADSLSRVGLDTDNMAPLLHGTSPPRVLIEFEVWNGTREPVYLALSRTTPQGVYSYTWLDTHALLRVDTTDADCVIQGTCRLLHPPDATMVSKLFEPLPSEFTELRLASTAGLVEVPCAGCLAGEYLILPETRYRIQITTTHLSFLALSGIQAGEVALIAFPGEAFHLTGTLASTQYPLCFRYKDMTFICTERRDLTQYNALISAYLEIHDLRVGGMTRSSLSTHLRVPNAPYTTNIYYTFSSPVHGSFSWQTQEAQLPPAYDISIP